MDFIVIFVLVERNWFFSLSAYLWPPTHVSMAGYPGMVQSQSIHMSAWQAIMEWYNLNPYICQHGRLSWNGIISIHTYVSMAGYHGMV